MATTTTTTSVRNLEYQSVFAADVINVAWKIEDLYKQTTIGESAGVSTSTGAVAVPTTIRVAAAQSGNSGRNRTTTSKTARSPQSLPSTKEIISLEIDGKPSSSSSATTAGNKGSTPPKWIFSLNFNGGESGEWKLGLDRKPTSSADEPVIVEVDMKILNRDGSEFWKESSGPMWVRDIRTQKSTQNENLMECENCERYTKVCACNEYGYCPNCCFTHGCCKAHTANKTDSLALGNVGTWTIGNALEVHDVLNDGSLTIYIELKQLERSAHCVRNTISAMGAYQGDGGKKLAGDLGDLRKSGLATNVEIKVKGTGGVKVFKAHKCILAARSAVLERMLSTGSLDDEIMVDDISPDAVDIILDYIYSGSVNMNIIHNANVDSTKIVTELIEAAKKWELTELKTLVGSHLVACCDTKNAWKLLDLACQNEITAAADDIKMFIRNNMDDILAEFGSGPLPASLQQVNKRARTSI